MFVSLYVCFPHIIKNRKKAFAFFLGGCLFLNDETNKKKIAKALIEIMELHYLSQMCMYHAQALVYTCRCLLNLTYLYNCDINSSSCHGHEMILLFAHEKHSSDLHPCDFYQVKFPTT